MLWGEHASFSPEVLQKVGAKLGAKTINASHFVSIRMDNNTLVCAQTTGHACEKSSPIQREFWISVLLSNELLTSTEIGELEKLKQ